MTDSTATTNGSRLTITSASSNQEFAAIKFASSYASNTTYTLSYSLPTFTEPTGQDTWLQMGFTYNSTTGARSNTIGSIGVLRGAGNAQWSTSSANGSSTLVGGTITHTSLVDNATTGTMVTITLDTATGLENFYLGTLTPTGTPDYSFTYTTLPTVTSGLYVAIQNFSNTAPSGGPTVSNFPISQITLLSTPDVPEPSTYAMLLAGVGALAFIVRARRAAAAV